MPFADLTDVRCYYDLLGAGDPVLLIPGLGTTCAMWDGVTEELSKSFTLIVLDNRGLGKSVAKRPPQSLADFAIDLVELLDHLQLERAHVVGLSLGGIIAQQLALDHPSRVDRLVLISCTNRFGPYLLEVAKLLAQSCGGISRRSCSAEQLSCSALRRDTSTRTRTRPNRKLPWHVNRRFLAARCQHWQRCACLGCNDLAAGGSYRISGPNAGDRRRARHGSPPATAIGWHARFPEANSSWCASVGTIR